MKFATWNILTLNFPGTELLFASELRQYSVTIACVTKIHLPVKGKIFISDIYILIWSGTGNTRSADGLVLRKTATNALISHNTILECLLAACLKHRHWRLFVIVWCVPTNEADHDVEDQFYIDFTPLTSSACPHDLLLLFWDFNATFSDPTGIWKDVMGRVSPDVIGHNGNRLLQLCRTHWIVISNTVAEKPRIHQCTWYSNACITKTLLILLSLGWRLPVSNWHSFRRADE